MPDKYRCFPFVLETPQGSILGPPLFHIFLTIKDGLLIKRSSITRVIIYINRVFLCSDFKLYACELRLNSFLYDYGVKYDIICNKWRDYKSVGSDLGMVLQVIYINIYSIILSRKRGCIPLTYASNVSVFYYGDNEDKIIETESLE